MPSLDVWIRNAMTDEDKDGPLTALYLRHMVNGAPSQIIHKITFGKAGKSYMPDQLARTLYGVADGLAGGLPGVQVFKVEAVYNDRPEAEAFYTFQRRGQAFDEGASELPNEQGERAQRMRTNDNLMALTFKRQQQLDDAFNQIITTQNETIRMLGMRVNELTHENVEAFNIVRDMMGQQALNQHEYRMKEIAEQNKQALIQKAVQLGPPLINQLTGREVFPQSTEDTAILDAVAEAIDPDKIHQLMHAINVSDKPELVAMIMTRFNKALEKKAQKEQERKALLQASKHLDGENDAAGD